MSELSAVPAPLLAVESLSSGYGGSTVLHKVDLNLMPNEFVALIGRNGVGKTTLVRSVTGRVKPREGRVLWHGEEATDFPTYRWARVGLRWVDEDRGLSPNLTVAENLELATLHATSDAGQPREAMERFPRLRERASQLAGSLSGGEQRMLALARALLARPDALILDEFSEGLQPSIVQELAQSLREAHADGLAIVLVEQNVRLALKLASRAYIMDKGRVVHEGPAEALAEDEQLLRRHLVV